MAGAVSFGTGATSGIDWKAITDAYINADSQPITDLKQKNTIMNGAKSTFNNLSTQLAQFKATLQALHDGTTVGGKIGTVTGMPSGVNAPLGITAGSSALAGNYDVKINSLAYAKRVRSAAMTDAVSPAVNDGKITIKAGANDAITIDVSAETGNNSLQAIADAVNNANKGVAASIVNDGTGSILVLKSQKTGTDNDLTITDTTNLKLNDAANVLQQAKNASINIDGIAITSQTNQISSAIPGVDLTLNAETTAYGSVKVNIADDVAGTKKALQDLVDGYNKVNDLFQSQLGSADAISMSTVSGSSIFRNIQNQLQSMLTASVTGIADGKVNSLAELGIEVADRTGKLQLNSAAFDRLISDGRFDEVQAVLQSSGSASDNTVMFMSSGTVTTAGTYALNITQAARQATVEGSGAIDATNGLAQNESLTIALGTSSQSVDLAAGDKVGDVVAKINTALKSAGIGAIADSDNGKLRIRSTEFGSAQSISVTSSLANSASQTGFDTTAATGTGVDVAGTIGGFAAVGVGRDLTGAEGTAVEGLSVRIYATDATVAGKAGNFGNVGYSQGMTDQFMATIKGITDPISGTIQSVTKGFDDSIKVNQDKIDRINDQLTAKREMLTKQFAAAEAAVTQLNQMMSSLNSKSS